MNTLLVIDSSARVSRSVTRHLTARFASSWSAAGGSAQLILRDVGRHPPAPLDETWVAAAFDDSRDRSHQLAESERLIGEIARADAIVVGVPMYNYGIPAQLKAWFDQVIRIGRTFAYHPHSPQPYRPLLAPKPCVIITSVSDSALYPGGPQAHLNCLEPHLDTLWGFLGVTCAGWVRATEGLLRDRAALARVESQVDTIAAQLRPAAAR